MYAIQIKICEEYRDTLLVPRLFMQEPGLRPIGRSPSVPEKSSQVLNFSPESILISEVLELGQVMLFWKLIQSRIWQLPQTW